MQDLIAGYHRFRELTWPRQRERFATLAEGQSPKTLVIACSDSRADPAMIFDAAPGELFVVRNVAGLAPPYQPDGGRHGVSAALEFGVRVLGVERIVVLGHARCGGVAALVHGAPPEAQDFIPPWVEIARPALSFVEPDGDPDLDACEKAVVRVSIENLRGFPWIAEAEAAGRLRLIGARFDIASGELTTMDADGRFIPPG